MIEIENLKYRIEEFLREMTTFEKRLFLQNLLSAKKNSGKNLFTDRSRLYRIRAAKASSNTNATSEQLRAILKELNDVFPEEGLTIENIHNISEAIAA